MTLRIHIDRLVLDGFDFSAREAAHLESALRAELASRLGVSGISDELRSTASVDALRPAQVSLGRTPGARPAGRAIARAIHKGIAP